MDVRFAISFNLLKMSSTILCTWRWRLPRLCSPSRELNMRLLPQTPDKLRRRIKFSGTCFSVWCLYSALGSSWIPSWELSMIKNLARGILFFAVEVHRYHNLHLQVPEPKFHNLPLPALVLKFPRIRA